MAKKNDNTILELKKQIADKEAALDAIRRFIPATNCSLELEGTRYNLHVSDANLLTTALLKLNMYKMSADNLGLEDIEFSGYKIVDWVADIQSRLLQINKQKEQARLNNLKSKLTALLSIDKKTELEIEELKNAI